MKALAFALVLVGCAHAPPAPSGMIVGVDLPSRLYCVERDDAGQCRIYRSAQPTAAGFRALIARLGVRSVVKLNGELPFDGGPDVVSGGIYVAHDGWLPAGPVTDDQMAEALEDLRALADSRPPVLVHCTYGIDRTGELVALRRVDRGSLVWGCVAGVARVRPW